MISASSIQQRLAVLALLGCAAVLAACASSSESPCPPCQTGYVCDPQQKRCVAQTPTGCNPACGTNSTCKPTNACGCNAGYSDCNGDLGQASSDGCECQGTCNGAACASSAGCSPNTLRDCGDATRYCNIDKCADCPAGSYNCDGTKECEATEPCGSGGCDSIGANACGLSTQYCDDATKTCKDCPSGTFNCDLNGTECDCKTACEGTSCKSECNGADGCDDITKYCDMGKCKACPANQFNCDNKESCECSAGCNGTACQGQTSCQYKDQDPCGGDQSLWCWDGGASGVGECTSCSNGFFNCNLTWGCECAKTGSGGCTDAADCCDGRQCRYICSGGECP